MSKYKNGKVEIHGIRFDSAVQGERYKILKAKEQGGLIKNLELQKTYPLLVNGLKICDYRADFVYEVGGKTIVEDVKGMLMTPFKFKYKLMFACYGIKILVTKAEYQSIGGKLYVSGFIADDKGLVLPKAPTVKKGKKK